MRTNSKLKTKRLIERLENWQGKVTSIKWSCKKLKMKLRMKEEGLWPKKKVITGK